MHNAWTLYSLVLQWASFKYGKRKRFSKEFNFVSGVKVHYKIFLFLIFGIISSRVPWNFSFAKKLLAISIAHVHCDLAPVIQIYLAAVCIDSGSVFPTEHSLRTRTQARRECTQVHDEKQSSKLSKLMSVPFRADKPLICHLEKRCMRPKSRFLSRRKPCAYMRSLSRHWLRDIGSFSMQLILYY